MMDESEMEDIRRIAERNRVTVAEWVRQALRAQRRQEPIRDAGEKLKAIREAARYCFPAGDVDEMNAEIERGYRD